MATWQAVQEGMRARYALELDEPEEFALTLTMPGGEGRLQRVMVRTYQARGRALIELRSAFAEREGLDAEALLRQGLTLELGAIALHGPYCVVLHKASLDELSVEALLERVHWIAEIADRLEHAMGGDRF